jgi:hypothetical protein
MARPAARFQIRSKARPPARFLARCHCRFESTETATLRRAEKLIPKANAEATMARPAPPTNMEALVLLAALPLTRVPACGGAPAESTVRLHVREILIEEGR